MRADERALRDYYDDLLGGLLSGYVYGNARIQSAIAFVLAWTPANAHRILEAGCGIGECTEALKRRRPEAFVLGIDAHPRLADYARRLFADSGAVFACNDIMAHASEGAPFDVIVMMDVYEHIPRDARAILHASVARLLSPAGTLLLTTPSISHQRYLREERRGVQPIDEDVSRDDLERLAQDIGGTLAHYETVSVWRADDYVHAVITRDRHVHAGPDQIEAVDRRAREKQVERHLALRVSRKGVLLPARDGANVCVIQPNCDAYSERLIRDQLERLPANVTMLCDGWFPRRLWNGERLQPAALAIARRVANALHSPALANRVSRLGLTRFLRRHHVDVVLAQYGPVGCAIMDACRDADVPLVVQFHGFDAHYRPTLDHHRDQYQRLFTHAVALIAVSRHMAKQLVALGAPPEKVHCNPGGVDCARFNGAHPALAPRQFVNVARFVDKKAPHLTLNAFQRVQAAYPDATLVMIGDGPLLASSRDVARSIGIESAVDFRGACSAFEVRSALRSARAFVLHSIETADGDSEGTPIALLEAAATGLPVVATRHAGIADVVIEGGTGYLVEEHDVDAMAERMISLAADPDLAARQGAAGRAHVAANYSIEKHIAALWTVIDAAASHRTPSSVTTLEDADGPLRQGSMDRR